MINDEQRLVTAADIALTVALTVTSYIGHTDCRRAIELVNCLYFRNPDSGVNPSGALNEYK